MTLSQMIEKIEKEFTDKHSRCIATDAEYTDKEMVEILSNYIKSSFEEDLKFLKDSLLSFAHEIREEVKVERKKVRCSENDGEKCTPNCGWNAALKEVEERWNDLLKP